jgi:hypothetical protein
VLRYTFSITFVDRSGSETVVVNRDARGRELAALAVVTHTRGPRPEQALVLDPAHAADLAHDHDRWLAFGSGDNGAGGDETVCSDYHQ